MMKKALICALALMLALPMTGCAENFLEFLFGKPSSGLTLRYVPAAPEAFATLSDPAREACLIGISSDGNMLLMSDGYSEIYCWDQAAGKRVPVTFADPAEAEALTAMIPGAVVRIMGGSSLSRQQREERTEQTKAKQDAYLSGVGQKVFADMDQISECYPHMLSLNVTCLGLTDRWALLQCMNMPCSLAIDLHTGASRVFLESNQPRSFSDGKILLPEGIMDLETGLMLDPDQIGLMPAADDGRPDLTVLPSQITLGADGSLLAIGCDGAISPDGNDYWLIDAARDYNRAVMIGSFGFGDAPGRIMISGDGRTLMLLKSGSAMAASQILMNRESGEKTVYERGKLLPVAPTQSGFLCWDLNTYDVLLIGPDGGSGERVDLRGDLDWSTLDLTAVSYTIGNGKGMYFVTRPSLNLTSNGRTVVHGYLLLEGE
ncbi:MAG: hypothetical protein IKP10_06185 [Clostridia bacterium]|nr:hypothetical protein [Clostridia bacterium]